MKKSTFPFLVIIFFITCTHIDNTSTLSLSGSIDNSEIKKLYLFEVLNQHYSSIKLLDSIAIINRKFHYSNDSLDTQLYFLSMSDNPRIKQTFDEGGYIFLQKAQNNIEIHINEQGKPFIDNRSFIAQLQLVEFSKKKDKVSNRAVLDSLDQLFYAAREAKNEEEMMRIKEESMPYYNQSRAETQKWLSNEISENKTSLFGLYLFYTYQFQNYNFSTLDEIANIRKRLEQVDDKAKQSVYYTKIEDRLAILEKCAIGHEAPEIVGLDTLDNEVKLSDFRGKYVLVDFWSSSCTWCRAETPNFQKTHTDFKDKNLVILGVSSDFKKEDWIRAIHEDKSYWNQIMMKKDDIQKTMNSYAIVGIPEILLIDPQGIILAKGLRGEDIYNAVADYVK